MTSDGPEKLDAIMAGSDRLKALEQARRERQALTDQSRSWLPAELAPHLVAADRAPGVLVLSFESAAWAARARYVERDILAAAADPGFTRIKVRVHPEGGNRR